MTVLCAGCRGTHELREVAGTLLYECRGSTRIALRLPAHGPPPPQYVPITWTNDDGTTRTRTYTYPGRRRSYSWRPPVVVNPRSGNARGYTARYRKARARLLRAHPWCPCGNAATVADHHPPLSSYPPGTILDTPEILATLRPSCRPCSDAQGGALRARVRARPPVKVTGRTDLGASRRWIG